MKYAIVAMTKKPDFDKMFNNVGQPKVHVVEVLYNTEKQLEQTVNDFQHYLQLVKILMTENGIQDDCKEMEKYYKNHCLALNDCQGYDIKVTHKDLEKEVMLKKLVELWEEN